MLNYSPFKDNCTIYYCKHASVLAQIAQYFCPILAQIKFSIQISIRVPSTKSHKNVSRGS